MILQIFIMLQLIAIGVFYLAFRNKNPIMITSLFAVSTILFAIVGFSCYNIEFIKSFPDSITTTEQTDINNITTKTTTINYSKMYMYHQSLPLFWLNIGTAVISFVLALLSVFNAIDWNWKVS